MFALMVISSIAGALVALIGFSAYGTDIQLTIAFIGCAWCLISAGIAGVLKQLSSLRKDYEESRDRPHSSDQYRGASREQYSDERRDPDFY